ncbi:endo-1,4-beta-xylanase [Phycisphaera mikurensis]|uniref:Beta-xylanase n=1 Tax=Phycisphaera mikurensis (strain NBRC 102666 / KCTC 22515 / FYK2301M01) TaxID=1142394 RepID=I0ICW9_PHYMF|nr:endo-1,4-beta-xylanase [Phycisphaera mikurensis]MBB6442237.1 GH35 family endo-1,4-beta-xylanase [Phycisphaera mikurensis]BAM03107.1 putative glycoside hydrolase [Phycisphaera mikurensis NBRC 102666]
MLPLLRLAAVVILCVLPPGAAAVAAPDEPAVVGGETLGDGDGFLAAFTLRNPDGDPDRGTAAPATGPGGGPAVRLTSRARGDFWHVEWTTGDFPQIRRGDVLLLRFHARTLSSEQEDGLGTITAFVQQNERPFNPSLMETVSIGPEWTRIALPFRSLQDYPPDGDQLTLGVGGAVQELEVAGVGLLRFPAGTRVRDLPVTRITYPGREPDAPWRAAAERRIRELRTSPMTVAVVDADGRPVAGAEVRVDHLRHGFAFGTAVRVETLLGNDADAAAYREKLFAHFNTATPENGLKWGRWEDPRHRTATMRALRVLRDAGLAVRGHALVWPSWAKSRVDLTAERAAAEAGDTQPLREKIEAHLVDVLRETSGLVDAWDVVNEPWNHHDFMDLLGDEAMVRWFEIARRQAPRKKLFLNDFGILTVGDQETDGHQDHYFKTISYLLDRGAPLDAIGVQGHFGSAGLTPPDRIERILDRFAGFGLPITITEFDLMTQDEELQADYTRDLLTVAFSHPAVDGFILWGFWDGAHWRGNAAMYRRDWTLKPAGRAILDLMDAWSTHATVTTDASGVATLTAFHGDYELGVEAPAGRGSVAFTLRPGTTEAAISLTPAR